MNLRTILVFLNLLSIYSPLLAQKIEKPGKISQGDFDVSNFSQPTILKNNLLVTFPYKGANNEAGALDKLFSFRIEAVVRACFSLSDAHKNVFLLPENYGNEPYIHSISYYYTQGNRIIEEKVKKSDEIIIKDSIGYYINCKAIIKHEHSIVDIYYSSRIADASAKKAILFYLNDLMVYRDFSAQIFVPEIYSYIDSLRSSNTNIEIEKGLLGPLIGYRASTGPTEKLLPKVLVEIFTKEFGLSYTEVNCSNYLISVTLKDEIKNEIWSSTNPILGLYLSSVTEIK